MLLKLAPGAIILLLQKTLRVTRTDHKHCLKCVDAKEEETHKAKEGEIIARKMSLALKKRL